MIITATRLRSAIHHGGRANVIRLGISLGLRLSLLEQLGTEALVYRVLAATEGAIPWRRPDAVRVDLHVSEGP